MQYEDMKTIDITKYGRPHPARPRELFYVDAAHGKEVADKVGLLEAVKAGEVDIHIAGQKGNMGGFGYRNTPYDGFIKGFIGPTAREVGIDEFVKRVSVCGEKLNLDVWGYNFYGVVCKYLLSEQKRLAKEAKKKAREVSPTVWSKPMQFLIPEIGTVLKLKDDWTFRLHYESRNDDMLKQVGITDYHYDKIGDKVGDITIKAGTELSVSRIYIRNGGSDYSSITFYLPPKSVFVFKGKDIASKGKCRFWAKLGDVNKMVVMIDTNTLAEN
jgi:hypothetical protein